MISPFNESFYREELDNNFTLKQLHIIAQMLDVEEAFQAQRPAMC